MAATAVPCASFARLSVTSYSSSSTVTHPAAPLVAVAPPLRSCGFLSTPLSIAVGRSGCPVAPRRVVIRAKAEKGGPVTKKKEDSAVKRARLAEERRVYNKSRKTEIKTRMKKVFVALASLKKQGAEGPEAIKPVETLIAQAFKIIDKSVKVGTLHKNTGGNRKSRLSRAKRALEIEMGWYTPATGS